jgi:predicted transcriptional regulator
MSNEEFERKMEFIVEQQAQFASDIQQLREAQARTEQVVAHSGEIVSQTGEIVARLANVTLEGFKDVNAKIDALVDSQIRTDENLRRTDESLRNLIAVVDRYFSNGRNGE